MLIYMLLLFLMTFIASKVTTNVIISNNNEDIQVISPLPLQLITNGSSNSSLVENQLQDQILLSNTSLNDLQNDNNTQQLQLRFRERKRQERLLLIQAQILQRLGITGRSINPMNNSNVNTFTEEERRILSRVVQRVPPPTRTRSTGGRVSGVNEIISSEIFAQRLQSFYPSCTVPNHSDPHLWNHNTGNEMKLYYNITFPRSSESQYLVNVMSAKLRLYKYNDPPIIHNISNFVISNTAIDEYILQQGITISIYQYMRPLKQNRKEKKRLIDSRSVSLNFRGWIQLNIINAINHLQHNPNRNFGFYIDMEDPYGDRMDPALYINPMNCSVEIPDITVRDTPMPYLLQLYPEANETTLFDKESFPTLDLTTIETIGEQLATSSNYLNNNANNFK